MLLRALNVPALLRQFNLHPDKSLGQNFLVDEGALAKVAGAAEVGVEETVLEIGPGLGSLTRHLAVAARRVVAVELDEGLLPALTAVLKPYPNVEVIQGDILNLSPLALGLPPGYKVAANIPYYITSAVIRHLLEAESHPARVVLTVQREVAERLCAKPGEMSVLAVSVQFYSVPRIVGRIPAGAFYPRPNVDSAVVRLDVLPRWAVDVQDSETFFRVVKAGFSQKRKQLRNALSGGLQLSAEQVEAWLARAGLDLRRRAETLALEEWGALCAALPSDLIRRQEKHETRGAGLLRD
jgi:16S rRNA (adenine1518-N6/adenine1519-N6)-dimethyltransferase